MNLYEKQIQKELTDWYGDIVKSAGVIKRTSDRVQKKAQQLVPAKMQGAVTAAVEALVKTILTGSGLVSVKEDTSGMVLAERDYLVLQHFKGYRTTATVQGAGFGMGGVLLGMADLPVLLGIKVKFLFDTAKLYGFNPELPEERLFLLHVFQLAFSSREYRLKVFGQIERWDEQPHPEVDWEQFQIEYRDYLDLAKLLQLLPVVGSVAGGTANHKLMGRLCENAMNCYRMRILGYRQG